MKKADERGGRRRGELASKGEPLSFVVQRFILAETESGDRLVPRIIMSPAWKGRHQSFASIAKVALPPLLTFGKVDFV